jgi:hypothetical protein
MTKNLSALTFMEDRDPAMAEVYKMQVKEAKRARSRDYQKKLMKAYKENTKE